MPLLFLSLTYEVEAQKRIMSCNILDVISKEDAFGNKPKENTHSVYEYDSSGSVTEKNFGQSGAPSQKETIQNIILIDTFGFFTPECNGRYDNRNIEVYSTISSVKEQKQYFKNIYWVSRIETGKENALGIGIVSKSLNVFHVFYVAISGNDVKIIKKKSGDF